MSKYKERAMKMLIAMGFSKEEAGPIAERLESMRGDMEKFAVDRGIRVIK